MVNNEICKSGIAENTKRNRWKCSSHGKPFSGFDDGADKKNRTMKSSFQQSAY